MTGPSAEGRMATAERLLGLAVLAKEAAERNAVDEESEKVVAWEHYDVAIRERDEARAEVVRLREAVTIQRNHWQAMLTHYPDDETVEVTTESARIAEARLTAVLGEPK